MTLVRASRFSSHLILDKSKTNKVIKPIFDILFKSNTND